MASKYQFISSSHVLIYDMKAYCGQGNRRDKQYVKFMVTRSFSKQTKMRHRNFVTINFLQTQKCHCALKNKNNLLNQASMQKCIKLCFTFIIVV